MKKLFTSFILVIILLPLSFIYSQTYMNIKYQDGSEKYKEITSLRKITFTSAGSQINYYLTDNSTVTEDISTLSKITFGSSSSGSPLPVEITSFTAIPKDNSIVLNWSTATEVNNYGFEIQKSLVTSHQSLDNPKSEIQNPKWDRVGFVQGAGNSNSPKQYSFADANPGKGNLQYRLKQIDLDGNYKYYQTIAEVNFNVTDVKPEQLPKEFSLEQNYPNPFNPSTVISYQLPVNGHVELKIYDILGKEVAVLVNGEKAAGHYHVEFSAGSLSTGIYVYRISVQSDKQTVSGTAGSFTAIKKLMLIK